jgi:hypothetical protein
MYRDQITITEADEQFGVWWAKARFLPTIVFVHPTVVRAAGFARIKVGDSFEADLEMGKQYLHATSLRRIVQR